MLIVKFGGSSVAHDLFSKSLRGIVRAKCPKESQGGWEEVQGNHPSNLEEGAGPGRRENDRRSSPCARGVEVSSQLEPDTSGLQTLRQNASHAPICTDSPSRKERLHRWRRKIESSQPAGLALGLVTPALQAIEPCGMNRPQGVGVGIWA